MGVLCDQVDEPFEAELEPVKKATPPAAAVPTDSYSVLDARVNASYKAAFALLKEKAEVFRSRDAVKGPDSSSHRKLPCQEQPRRPKILAAEAGKTGLPFSGCPISGPFPRLRSRTPDRTLSVLAEQCRRRLDAALSSTTSASLFHDAPRRPFSGQGQEARPPGRL